MAIIDSLKQAGIFQDLTPAQIQLLASIAAERACAAGEVVFEEGSDGSELYIVARGSVAIQIRTGDISETIARLGAGESFGEVTLVDSGRRSARAICLEDSTLLAIGRDRLNVLCDNFPTLGHKLMRNLAADLAMKIRTTDSQMSQLLARLRTLP